jgi:hypothetical protein
MVFFISELNDAETKIRVEMKDCNRNNQIKNQNTTNVIPLLIEAMFTCLFEGVTSN